MKQLGLLNRLPKEVKDKITSKYGSLEKFYEYVYNLHQQEHSFYNDKVDPTRSKRLEIRNKIYDVEEELESFGIEDGSNITIEISNDFGDYLLSKILRKSDN